jgi:uncharacterized integral membrane protein
MIILFILGLVLGGVAVIFSFQNISAVSVVFLGWTFESSMAVVLSLSVLTGILIALLLTLPELVTNYFQNRSLKTKIKVLEEDLRKQRELAHFARKAPPTEETITHIEQGAINQ